MKILVCIKQVPESESPVTIDERSRWISIGATSEFRMNRFDECAVEEAVRIKDSLPGTFVHIISVGPERADAVIRRAIGMGADHGTHIITKGDMFYEAAVTAKWIAASVDKKSIDLFLTGSMSEDLMQGQVGPMLAEMLSVPCATNIVHLAVAPDGKSVYAEREIEGGYRESLEITLPALLTIQTGINKPRYPSLSNLLRANKLKLEIDHIDSSRQISPRQVVKQVVPPRKLRNGIILDGTSEQKAERLARILADRALIH